MTEPTSPATPAGWYPDSVPGMERYWDGATWSHEQVRPIGTPDQAPAGGMILAPAPKKPWYKRKAIVIPVAVVGGVIVLSSIINGVNGGDPEQTVANPTSTSDVAEEEEPAEEEPVEVVDTRVEIADLTGLTVAQARIELAAAGLTLVSGEAGDDWLVTTQAPVGGEKREPGTSVSVTAEAPAPVYTLSQRNALSQAESYLSHQSFSRQGLIEQLQYEGYSIEDSTFAVDTVVVDWNAQAAATAQSYLSHMSFSREGLYDQLAYENFSPEQIEFALAAVGY